MRRRSAWLGATGLGGARAAGLRSRPRIAVAIGVCGLVSACLVAAAGPSAQAAGAGGTLTWTSAGTFDPHAGTTHPVTGLGCTPSGFCLAVDSAGRTFTWTGAWHAAPAISRRVGYVSGLSCVTGSFCMAIASEGSPASSSSYAVRWNGTRWDAPVRLYRGSGEAALYGTVRGLSCTSTLFCIAVGAQVGSLVFNGSRWTKHEGSTSGTDGQGVVGCASSRFCIDIHDDLANYWNGGSWRWGAANSKLSSGLIPGLNGFAFGVSCVSATFCVAAAGSTAPLVWNGTTWRFASHALSRGGGFESVSCTSTSFCVAGGQNDLAASWNGTTWAFTSPPQLPDAPVLVSCSRTGSCLAASADGASAITVPAS
jgi:hypothetical protein